MDFRSYSAAFHAQNGDVLHYGVKGMKWKHHKRGLIDIFTKSKDEREKSREEYRDIGATTLDMTEEEKAKQRKRQADQAKSDKFNKGIVNELVKNRKQPVGVQIVKGLINSVPTKKTIFRNNALHKGQHYDSRSKSWVGKDYGKKMSPDSVRRSSDSSAGGKRIGSTDDKKRRRRGRYADRNK